jgi:hypothetical protein
MKFIGNYYSWIDPLWEHKILTNNGQARPRDWPPKFLAESREYQLASEAGYDLNAVHWWVYEEKDLNLNIAPFWTTGDVHWWFTKLTPGQFMPMHTDPHVYDRDCKRYWMPLQDYAPGHIFVYKDEMITGYKAGDLFQFENSNDIHGAANIGHTPRLMLLVTEYL